MRGSAVYDEATAVFGMVACGPCGVPDGWVGDGDASFADWYGAHEIGHTFQRRHPGFPGSQPRDPLETRSPILRASSAPTDQVFVGFDIGDPALGLPMTALPGNIYHDVMTYADSQWLSAYTYEGIHDRLLQRGRNTRHRSSADAGAGREDATGWHHSRRNSFTSSGPST